MDPNQYPPTSYLRAVPAPVIHRYTALQTGCLAVLWVFKSSILGLLDSEEHPEDKKYQETMPG